MPNGWSVRVSISSNGAGTSRQIYYVHVPDKKMAEEAVKCHISATQEVRIEALKTLAHKVMVEEKIAEGAAKRWM